MRRYVRNVVSTTLGLLVAMLLAGSVQSCSCSDSSSSSCGSDTQPKATPDELAIAGSYSLVLIGATPPPVETGGGYTGSSAPFGQCFLVIDSGTLELRTDLSYFMTRAAHYKCPNGNGGFNAGVPFSVTATGTWSNSGGDISMSQVTNTDFSIIAVKVNASNQIVVDESLVGCAPQPGFVCVAVPEIVFKFGK